jgi:hypothetical protein
MILAALSGVLARVGEGGVGAREAASYSNPVASEFD